ncbi:MAG: SEC-C domain-containing protein [Ignavibacteriales bacterium]|nr:SEC-C domain-containing protein [Ignavibacteriales bacterium]
MKIGRNQPCPCNSGLKYKKCCGSPRKEQSRSFQPYPRQIPSDMHTIIEHHKADELIRQQQQGLGKPIIATKFKDRQVVAVGNTIYHSPNWKTFPDFLSDYLKMTLGREWGNNEISKPLLERHPIMQWYDEYCRYQKKYMEIPGEIRSTPAVGVVYCYLGLAYNLYLLKHNVKLQERFIKRLKNIGNFQGAYYELIVANCLIRAGFELTLEDETDESSKHCEFAAILKGTGKKYWVEAKMRGVAGFLGKSDKDGTKDSDPTCMLSKHLNGALKKPAEDERLIFIDFNATPQTDQSIPSWGERAAKKLDMREKELEPGQYAYVFLTNMSFHRSLDSEYPGQAIMAYGLGIPDFSKPGHYRLPEIYRRKQKHIDAHKIVGAFGKYPQIPSTFDGTLPSETFNKKSQRLVIGETYFFENIGKSGVIGMVTAATVSANEKEIYFAITTENGKNQILTRPMTEDELIDYKNHPEAFFGNIQQPPKKTEELYDLFEFFVDSYHETPKERLLEFMKDAPDFDALIKMQQFDLVLECCERWVDTTVNNSTNKGH